MDKIAALPAMQDITISLMIIYLLIREVVIPLLRPDPIRLLAQKIDGILTIWTENQHKINDIHRWMSPNDMGQQTWRDTSIMHQCRDSIGKLFSVINDGFTDIKDLIKK